MKPPTSWSMISPSTTRIPTIGPFLRAPMRFPTASTERQQLQPDMSIFDDFVLTAITREAAIIRGADAAGVDRIGIDIERLGKWRRQKHVTNARISSHNLDDLATV